MTSSNLSNPSPKAAGAVPLLAAGRPVEEVAHLLKVTPRTVYRWLSTPEFAAALQQARNRALGEAAERLAGLTTGAIDTLAGLLTDPRAGANVKRLAAADVLGWALRYYELTNLEARLQAVEDIILTKQERR